MGLRRKGGDGLLLTIINHSLKPLDAKRLIEPLHLLAFHSRAFEPHDRYVVRLVKSCELLGEGLGAFAELLDPFHHVWTFEGDGSLGFAVAFGVLEFHVRVSGRSMVGNGFDLAGATVMGVGTFVAC